MSSPPSLPLEVQLLIIAFVEHRKANLTFALVCHDWLAECRKTTFATQIDITKGWSINSGKGFLKLLKSPHSTIRRYMSRFHINYTILDPDDFQKVLCGLTRVSAPIEEISIYGEKDTWKEEYLDPLIELLRHASPSLQTLIIPVVCPTSLRQLLQIISAASSITHLTLIGLIGVNGLKASPRNISPPPASLQVLETNLIYRSLFATWVFRAENVKKYVVLGGMLPLRTILEQCDPADQTCNVTGLHGSVVDTNYLDRTRTAQFFSSSRCARALTHLAVSMKNLEDHRFGLDLTHAINLQSLSFDMVAPMEDFSRYRSWIVRCVETSRAKVIVVDCVISVRCPERAESHEIAEVDRGIDGLVSCMMACSRWQVRLITVSAIGYVRANQIGWNFPCSKAQASRVGSFSFKDDRERIGW